MDAYQYFYDGDEVVGRADVGTLEFDTRRGHHHWHLQQFAQYRLLDADQEHVRLSKKQSFCLAPTDPMDLSIEGAAWRQFGQDLGSACGGDAGASGSARPCRSAGATPTTRTAAARTSTSPTSRTAPTTSRSIANPTGELFETDDDEQHRPAGGHPQGQAWQPEGVRPGGGRHSGRGELRGR